MQLLTVVIPKLEAWQKEGEAGTKKITQWTRYLTIVLALLQSTGLAFLFHRGTITDAQGQPVDLFPEGGFTPSRVGLLVLSLTAGTALIMWLGELITQRGIGNGMSILIFASIISRFPSEGNAIYQQKGLGGLLFFFGIGIMVIIAVVTMEQGQRRIPVQYAKRVVGRRMTSGGSTYLPLRVNMAGVIPVIFAASIMAFPPTIGQLINTPAALDFAAFFEPNGWAYVIGEIFFIIVFTYFYTAVTFNPVDQADNLKKYGGFIPGVRPGRPTAEYLDRILSRLTFPGALYLGAVAALPTILISQTSANFFFGGTSILIVVGVALDTVKQLEAQLMMRNYEGFLK
ncbi:MAG: preprotein translocase subunit SecY, partial [Solirubrobacterales bacterium]